jgi:hypothetical protein
VDAAKRALRESVEADLKKKNKQVPPVNLLPHLRNFFFSLAFPFLLFSDIYVWSPLHTPGV